MVSQILGDRYEVERQIGKQTGRWTLLARDMTTQEQVIIKLLVLDEELDWDDLKLFEREVEILKSLSHPAIPRYLDFFEHSLPNDRAIALVRSHIDGRSLQQLVLQGRRLTETETKQVAKAMLLVLDYLHGQPSPIIHRDIKPSNILLANRQLYLIDFGSVKALSGNNDTAFTVVGTYGYMPPEQFSGRAIPASDLYSLGATLVTVLTGTHPSSLPRRGIKFDLTGVTSLSPEFTDWLEWLMEPNLEHRAKSAQEALQALEHGGRRLTGAAIAKPSDTKVWLTKDTNSLELLIPSRLGQLQLQIDPQQISLISKRLGFQSSRPLTAPRQAIHKLEYRRTATDEQDADAQLILWAGDQKFELRGNPLLTQEELEWLAFELATWLKLPVTRL
ncbi:serine/threonine protein kinase [Leptolyngbya sp. FACHB-36]|uniref:serine/threonine protein kinase n=1 Tax=Leptolyngbya sp. FACHB-36 TaxID=2692808 RepID=UPI0016805837|nr:serine/threonine-protein kinase [Leptolyngbya sp. FACHB-36]MBD2021702.1 serine/threonine protein kinase [Leptolyngbya sp. FACHB-36]